MNSPSLHLTVCSASCCFRLPRLPPCPPHHQNRLPSSSSPAPPSFFALAPSALSLLAQTPLPHQTLDPEEGGMGEEEKWWLRKLNILEYFFVKNPVSVCFWSWMFTPPKYHPHILLPRQNLPPTLPTMQLNHQQFSQRLGPVLPISLKHRRGAGYRGLVSSLLSNAAPPDFSDFVVCSPDWRWLNWHHLRQCIRHHTAPSGATTGFRQCLSCSSSLQVNRLNKSSKLSLESFAGIRDIIPK